MDFRAEINRIHNLKIILEQDNNQTLEEKQKKLRKFIKILRTDEINTGKEHFYLKYLIILHNFLFLEKMFYDDVKLTKKEINSHLRIPNLESVDEINDFAAKLYDVHSPVRFAIETFDSIEPIRQWLRGTKLDIYHKILSWEKITKNK